jgi:hypothetical protein
MDWISRHIYIQRLNDDGTVYRYIQVPVHYATRERWINVLNAVHQKHEYNDASTGLIDLNRILPRISLNVIAMVYEPEKHLSKFQQLRQAEANEDGSLGRIPAPVPYSLELEMTSISKTLDDNYQILEQIVPYFTPSLSLDMNLLDGFEPKSINFVLSNVQPEANEEVGIDEERLFTSTYTMGIKLEYPFIKTPISGATIKDIIAGFHVGEGSGADETFTKFKNYQLTVDNLVPETDPEDRAEEPITITQTDDPTESIAITVESGQDTISLADSDNTAQYTAIGTNPDGTTTDITALVTWVSTTTTVATIDSGSAGGLLTVVAAGTSNIVCVYQGVQSNTLVQTVTV